jgi:steroid 5-alpha reductase family enzyme
MAFFLFWVGQATWVSLVGLPVFAMNAVPPHLHPALNWKDFSGIAVWAAGFVIEVLADHQKTQWRKGKNEKRHNEDWISRGLWAKSRHPNYFGIFSLLLRYLWQVNVLFGWARFLLQRMRLTVYPFILLGLVML